MGNTIEMQVFPYSPQWHFRLLDYMRKVYPYRSAEYLDWWLGNIDAAGKVCWEKCVIVVLDDDTIVGCTTANMAKLTIGNDKKDWFLRGNTIISPDQRGKGISKGLYEFVNGYDNWLSVGITDIAWKIQPKYVRNFTPIQPIRIYIAVNLWVVGQFLRKLFGLQGNTKKDFVIPGQIDISKKNSFVRVQDVSEINVPESGRWTVDKVELVRDKNYFEKRFFDIYCAKRYGLYKYINDGELAGYVVLRKMCYAGLDMVAVVDYRFMDKTNERLAFAVANKLARKNNIGIVFGMSSRNYNVFGGPLLLHARKILNCAVGTKGIDFSDMLVTSADSDLDFVYYH